MQPAGNEFGEFLARRGVKTKAQLVILRGDVVHLAEEEFAAHRDLPVEKVGLGQRHGEIFALGADLNADAEFLAAAGKVRPPGDVEVALRDFREAEQTVDGAETGAEIEGSGALFLDDHIKILAPRDERILGVGVHLGEIIEVHQALLARVHAHGVEDIAGSESEFAADHLVLVGGIAGDIDVLEVALDAFVQIERHVEGAVRPGKRSFPPPGNRRSRAYRKDPGGV